jgi:hypothetical protein
MALFFSVSVKGKSNFKPKIDKDSKIKDNHFSFTIQKLNFDPFKWKT